MDEMGGRIVSESHCLLALGELCFVDMLFHDVKASVRYDHTQQRQPVVRSEI